MLLTEYNEEEHIRNEKEISREEGKEEEYEKGLENLVETLKEFLNTFDEVFAAIKKKEHYQNATKEQVERYYYT